MGGGRRVERLSVRRWGVVEVSKVQICIWIWINEKYYGSGSGSIENIMDPDPAKCCCFFISRSGSATLFVWVRKTDIFTTLQYTWTFFSWCSLGSRWFCSCSQASRSSSSRNKVGKSGQRQHMPGQPHLEWRLQLLKMIKLSCPAPVWACLFIYIIVSLFDEQTHMWAKC